MQIIDTYDTSSGEQVIKYLFNGKRYMHIGTWPPQYIPGFHVPIASAYVVDTGEDITRRVRQFAGPKHSITYEKIRYALSEWSWKVRWACGFGHFSCSLVPFLKIRKHTPTIVITDILGQVSTFSAK